LKRLGWTHAQYEKTGAEDVEKVTESWGLHRKDQHPHYMMWYPGMGRLKAETSLPNMLYNENVSLLQVADVERGIDRLSEELSLCTGSVLDAHTADIQGRVDFVFSYDTSWGGQGHVAEYLQAFKLLELPRHYSQNVARAATLYWRNQMRVIRLYDKEKESKRVEAKDNLRFEVQLNHAKAELAALVPGCGLKLQDVARWDVAKAVLGTYLDAMGADLVVSNERDLAQTLVDRVGPARARRLMGYVVFLRLYGREGMLQMGFDRTMPFRDKRELEAVGLAGTVNDRDGSSGVLPGLRLPENYSGQALRLGGDE
jgi:hypothetical protein